MSQALASAPAKRWDLRPSDALWLLLAPAYLILGTARHEASHAVAAVMQGARLEGIVVLPSMRDGNLYWGYTSYTGNVNWLVFAAPYLVDLLTVAVLLPLCRLARGWSRPVWLNLVVLGPLSPLVNSTYQYALSFARPFSDVALVRAAVPDTFVHAWFALTIPLYAWALFASVRATNR